MAVRTVTYDAMGTQLKEETVPVDKERALLILARTITEMQIKTLYVHYTLSDGTTHVCVIGDEESDVVKL